MLCVRRARRSNFHVAISQFRISQHLFLGVKVTPLLSRKVAHCTLVATHEPSSFTTLPFATPLCNTRKHQKIYVFHHGCRSWRKSMRSRPRRMRSSQEGNGMVPRRPIVEGQMPFGQAVLCCRTLVYGSRYDFYKRLNDRVTKNAVDIVRCLTRQKDID